MPLILFPIILLYIIFVIWGTINTVSRQETTKRKWLFSILIPSVFFLGPFADEFIARPYFYHLCNKEGGVRVHQVIELDKKYFDKNNEFIYLDEAYELEPFNVEDVYQYVHEPIKKYPSIFNIKRRKIYFIDKSKDKIISENNLFMYHGGYLHSYLMKAMPGDSIDCYDLISEEKRKLIEATFKLKAN